MPDENSHIKIPPQVLWAVIGVCLTAAGVTTAGQFGPKDVAPSHSTRAIEQKIVNLSRSMEAGFKDIKHKMEIRDQALEHRLRALECAVTADEHPGCGLMNWRKKDK